MTRKLEELLDLKPVNATEEPELPSPLELDNDELDEETADTLNKISASLPQVKGLGSSSDTELDELAKMAIDAYEDIMDLGMNVEARYSSRIFEVASGMLRNAIDAKSTKIANKLKMVELQLKQARLENEKKPKKQDDDDDGTLSGQAYVVTDRNSLIEQLKNMRGDK